MKEKGLEGIVGKKIDSRYYFGKETKDWKKIKALMNDDFVVLGYLRKDGGMTSVVLGQYDKGGSMRYQGHVTLGVRMVGNLPEIFPAHAERDVPLVAHAAAFVVLA